MAPYQVPQVTSYEVEFLAVGEGARSGDAIIASWVEQYGYRRVVVIDGGYKVNGEKIVEIVNDRFRTRHVDLVVSTHPDDDHANGLAVVLEECSVGELLMHKPWEHDLAGAGLYSYGGRFADRSLNAEVMKSLDAVKLLAEETLDAGIPVNEPYSGELHLGGVVEILGPTRAFYDSLLPDFRAGSTSSSLIASALNKAGGVITRVRESLDIETLTDAGVTSAENNSSAIVQLNFNGQRVLLTGDAGIQALDQAADYLDITGRTPATLRLAQVPHHGSKRNVGPTVLDRILGPKLGSDVNLRPAVVSAAPDGAPKHPAGQVTNAFRRRGAPVWATQGQSLRLDYNAPLAGYGPVDPLPLYSEVDE